MLLWDTVLIMEKMAEYSIIVLINLLQLSGLNVFKPILLILILIIIVIISIRGILCNCNDLSYFYPMKSPIQ